MRVMSVDENSPDPDAAEWRSTARDLVDGGLPLNVGDRFLKLAELEGAARHSISKGEAVVAQANRRLAHWQAVKQRLDGQHGRACTLVADLADRAERERNDLRDLLAKLKDHAEGVAMILDASRAAGGGDA